MQSNGLGRDSSALSFYSEMPTADNNRNFLGFALRSREHVGLIRLLHSTDEQAVLSSKARGSWELADGVSTWIIVTHSSDECA